MNRLREMWDFIKQINIHVIRISERGEKGVKTILKNDWKLQIWWEILIYTPKIQSSIW